MPFIVLKVTEMLKFGDKNTFEINASENANEINKCLK